jgi:glycopeptide antibiotics resistance protein
VTVFGAHVPVSVWTLVALVGGVAVSLLVWRRLARWWNWRPGATLGALLSLTVALTLTVTPVPGGTRLGLAACIPYDWNDLIYNVLYTGGGVFATLLNLVLLGPLAVSLVLATRRVLPAVAVGLLLPPAVELVQTQLPGRGCTVADWLANSAGAVLGAVVGWALQRRLRTAECLPASMQA